MVYLVDQETVNIRELYSVPIKGPAAVGIKINGHLVPNGIVYHYTISPDGSRVVYTADQETNNVFEIYSVPLGGPATAGIKLNEALGAGGSVNGEFFD